MRAANDAHRRIGRRPALQRIAVLFASGAEPAISPTEATKFRLGPRLSLPLDLDIPCRSYILATMVASMAPTVRL